MPSKRTTSPPLNDAEKMLMVVAIRISAATKYREEHPHLSDPNFGTNLSSEANYILEIYNKFPLPKGEFHRVHPAITALGIEAQLAKMEHRAINPENITTASIKKRCSATLKKYPQWPTILTSATIGSEVVRQADVVKWWLPLPSPDEGDNESDGDDELQGDDEPQGDENVDMYDDPPRRSGRINKGKARAAPDEITASARGQKRPVEAVSLSDDDDDGNDSLTPRRASNSNPRANVKVIVSSPPHARPKRRQRVGMDGESADVSSTNVEQSELVENMSDELWAGTGKEMCKECFDGKQEKCIPQWGATKPSKACTYCAGRKRSCTATQAWISMVETLKPFGGRIAALEGLDDAPTKVAGAAAAPKRRGRPPKNRPAPDNTRELVEKMYKEREVFRKFMVAVCDRLLIDITYAGDDDMNFTLRDVPDGALPSPITQQLGSLSLGQRSAVSSAHSSVRAPSAASSRGRSGQSSHSQTRAQTSASLSASRVPSKTRSSAK